MQRRIRIGAVGYLNARPLIHGLVRGLGAPHLALTLETPSRLAEGMAAGAFEIGLIPTIELGRIPGLELVPGLGIVTRGAARSVLLVSRRPIEAVKRVALDPESRTSNALVQLLFSQVWATQPEFVTGGIELSAALSTTDAAVRIGDKALFEAPPAGCTVHDLGEIWTRHCGLPFVFAAWAARPGVIDDALIELLHASYRQGLAAVDTIAAEYTWQGRRDPVVARDYLRHNIAHGLGTDELRGLQLFLRGAADLGLIAQGTEPRVITPRWEGGHALAAEERQP